MGENLKIMAAPMLQKFLRFGIFPGSSRNKRKVTPGKHREVKTLPGTLVHKGQILVRQLGLKIYPGENVGYAGDTSLVALEDGRTITSMENLSPYPRSPLYEPIKSGLTMKRMFIHVIPDPQIGRFKLKSKV